MLLEFRGTAVASEDGIVTFEVEEMTQPISRWWGTLPEPGSRVTVLFEDRDRGFMHVGERYLVPVGRAPLSRGGGYMAGFGYCSGNPRYADGSPIDTGLFTGDGFELWVVPAIIVPLAAAILMIRSIADRRHQRNVAVEFAAKLEEGGGTPARGRDG